MPATKTTTTTAATSAVADRGESTPRRGTTLAFIAVVAVLFVTLFTVLGYRSWLSPPPSSARFVVQGGAEHEGMLIHLESDSLPHPLEARLVKDQNYTVALSLPAGSYTISITRDGRLYYRQKGFYLHEHHLAHLPLKAMEEARRKAASRPA